MAALRSRSDELRYRTYLKSPGRADCVFCEPDVEEIRRETENFRIIHNRFAYTLWDARRVEDHLMIVPRKHIDSLGHFSPAMWEEFHKLIAEFEQNHYSIYARSPTSTAKSIVHQHTHLIRTSRKPINLLFASRKPFWRFVA